MTIAVGMYCIGGIIVAADTNVTAADGSRTQAVKVATAVSDSGSYVIANAADDGNAANTLVNHLRLDLEHNDCDSLLHIEGLIADRMTNWASAFKTMPSVQLVLAVNLRRGTSVPVRGLMGGGLALYFCEPPNTVLRKFEYDDSYGYVGIGSGSAVTDPIYKTMFLGIAPPIDRLKQIAYMMYRAKKDTVLCGGRTNAIFLKITEKEPIWITPIDMAYAENMGSSIDFLLRNTAAALLLSQSDSFAKEFADNTAKVITTHGAAFRALKFRSLQGDEIA